MQAHRTKLVLPVFFMLTLVMCMTGIVSAANGTVTITYRFAGDSYIGDTVYFDGTNTAGNVTVLKITGPGLPDAGVPLYDATGAVGSGNTIDVSTNNYWSFAWDTSRMKGSNLLQTARYTVTAYDRNHPEISSVIPVMLKRPEFYVIASQNPVAPGDYIQLTGFAEKGVSYVKIDITDPSGNIVHTFVSPVSTTGYFQYGFHVDMPPGQYRVIVSNPSMKSGLNQSLTVAIPITTQSNLTQSGTTAIPVLTTPAPAPVTTSPAPTNIPLSPICAIAGIAGAIALIWTTGRKNS
jgi:hypothetical protein